MAAVEVGAAQNEIQQRGSWIPSIDDLWDTIQRLKANFNQGLFKGLEQTFSDILFWIASWQIWSVYNPRDWVKYLLGLGT